MISIIIPTYNEEAHINNTILRIKEINCSFIKEIIVADGGSTDKTVEIATSAGAYVLHCNIKGRAAQMNAAAKVAKGTALYFLHADCMPPSNFASAIMHAVTDKNIVAGCFRLKFDYTHWFLQSQSWFTRFDINAFRYGDQSLFVKKEIFDCSGGFNEMLLIMEDNAIISHLKKFGRFKIVNDTVTTSARKYLENGIFKTQLIFYLIFLLHKVGWSQQKLVRLYRTLLKQDKL